MQGRGAGAHIQRVVIVLQVDEELRSLEVARGDAHVVLALQVVKLGEAPVYQAQLPLLRRGRSREGRRGAGEGPATRQGEGWAAAERAARWRWCAHLMVNHHVVRFDVAVHDPVGVAVLEGLRARRWQRVEWREGRRTQAQTTARGRISSGVERADSTGRPGEPQGAPVARQVVQVAEREGCARGWPEVRGGGEWWAPP